jgi:hypothetical protein
VLVKILRKVDDTDSSLVSLSDLVYLFGRKSLALLVDTFLDVELSVTNVNSRLAQIKKRYGLLLRAVTTKAVLENAQKTFNKQR